MKSKGGKVMKKLKVAIAYLCCLFLVYSFLVTRSESFDPKVISQISQSITEWKLVNKINSENQDESDIYVSPKLCTKNQIV